MKSKRYYAFMATITADLITLKKLKSIPLFKKNNGDLDFAIILHDKEEAKPHYHVSMVFKNAKTIKSVSKNIGFKENFIKKWDNRVNNIWSYLVHNTKDSRASKASYFDYVNNQRKFFCNFDDFKQRVATKTSTKSRQLDLVIEQILSGELTKKSLLMPDKIQFYHSNMRKIDSAMKLRVESLKYFAPDCKTIFISGPSGVGKTTLAIDMAKKFYNENFTIASSSNDFLQDYYGEKCLIIDDFRPQEYPFIELIAILDPLYRQRSHRSRYFNKPLATELIIITSVFSIYDISLFYYDKTNEDMKQLRRRIQTEIIYDDGNFIEYNYVPKLDAYSFLINNNKTIDFLSK